MKQSIVAIFDRKAEAFLKPVVVDSPAAAVRAWGDAINEPSSDFGKHPEDYSMWSIGTYCSSTGTFQPQENGNVELAKALALKNSD